MCCEMPVVMVVFAVRLEQVEEVGAVSTHMQHLLHVSSKEVACGRAATLARE
eukprot:CAMPEP_0119300370 /NCGR_PEP_ID=MMETSP1333-20130426/2319_1 /TAXON_ID=418940 /ORGANISM="Scyphosphaera apsteinii, Strain RCC1455" /LENGTH=51 /DNA_ID=CAMNT_0007302115 /DNA_START=1205 /DNA_END=1360 /DNA_ORIENTATION=-